jgi:diguanylate cyclase (GGDEF)-like protein/PAS domain S-box-containing protein
MARAASGEGPLLISTAPAQRADARRAGAVMVISLAIFVSVVPFVRVPLSPAWAFIPVYQSALATNDFITAVLLLTQFAILRSRAILVLASGYLFTAVMAAVHLLTFPGLFSATGLLGAGAQSTAWLYMFWHGVFPLTVIAYALLETRNGEPGPPSKSSSRVAIISSVAIVLAAAFGLALLATGGHGLLPSIMRENEYTPAMIIVVSMVWALSLAALLVLWLRRPHTLLDLWLMVVMWAWILDIGLSAVLNAKRFDVGFYAGRICGLLAATYVLIALLSEIGVLYARLAHLLAAEQQERRGEMEDRRRIFETSLDLILVTDRRGQFVRVSPSSRALLGHAPEEMIGRSAAGFIHADDLEPTRNEMRLARRGQDIRNFETRYIHKDGRIVSLLWSGVWSEPEERHFFIGRDVTEAKRAEESLKYLAHYDQLTGLPNRFSLHRDLGQLIGCHDDPGGASASVAVFDLDGFKEINDTLGHAVGDQLISAVAQRLTAKDFDCAKVYRMGGDEFVAVVPRCADPRTIAGIVDAMLQRLAERFEINGHSIYLGASAGIAIGPANGSNAEDLIANADLALYNAKRDGGRAYRLFLPAFRARAEARRQLDSELRRAFSEREFELYFQPQVRLGDGAVVGAEALLRWRHPERGVLGPGVFIDALAESPIARDLGGWILRTACEKAAAWRKLGYSSLRIGVNLFPAQFRDATLFNDVHEALAQTGLPAEALELEVTENIALGRDEELLAPLRALREKGVQIAFDDFGTGYASLSYLTRFPLSRIKIDQSFIRKISVNSEDTAVVRSIIVMAHNLGLQVIAEGVETAAQAAFLLAQKCEEVQGFLYAKPLPSAQFADFLRLRSAESRQRNEALG